MDKYVIDVPFLLRALLVRGIILQTRPKKSAAAYAKYGGTKVRHL
jgi:ferrochelatase